MNTTTDKMPCMALEAVKQETGVKQDKKDWAEYSQLIAAAMSKRMTELGLTQQMLAEKMGLSGNFWLVSFKISYLCLPLFHETRTTPSCHPSGCAYRQL